MLTIRCAREATRIEELPLAAAPALLRDGQTPLWFDLDSPTDAELHFLEENLHILNQSGTLNRFTVSGGNSVLMIVCKRCMICCCRAAGAVAVCDGDVPAGGGVTWAGVVGGFCAGATGVAG